MKTPQNYSEINRKSWNRRTDVHLNSEFYDQTGFLQGKSSLNEIELNLLGDVQGKSILHLQCHFGQDTISLSRMGAEVTGVDFSERAIEIAQHVAQETHANTTFMCCDVYDLPQHLDTQFDIVFTSYGTIGWLPDLDRWATIVAEFLKPDGQFIFVEFHPFVWMFDTNFEKIAYNYFNAGAIIETESGTYANRSADITQEYVTWNHSLSEVMTSLIKHGLDIQVFEEFDYSPYNCFQGTVEIEPKKYRISHLENNIPMVYALVAQKKTPFNSL